MHVLAVVIYVLIGDNLIKGMFTGYKHLKVEGLQPKMRQAWIGLVLFAIIFACVWFSVLANAVKYM